MTQQRIKAINYNMEEIGKYMKSSKKRFEWVVGLNKKTHTITLDFSFISGKVKVVIDGRVILENEIPINTSFQYPFTLDGFALNLIQQGQSCELRINNKVFSHLYIQAKTEQEFTREKGEFVIAPDKEFLSKINNHEKMTLDIGNGKKNRKVKESDEGGWGDFGGLGAPPGFEGPPGFEVTTVTTGGKASGNQGVGIDFFADDDEEAPSKVQTQKETEKKEVDFFDALDTSAPVVAPPKPAEINIQNLYSQSGTQNQFFTQIPNTLNFGTSQGTNIQQQFQTAGLQQNAFNGINFNSLSQPQQQSQPQSSQLNFGTNSVNLPYTQPNQSEVQFGTNNNFNTNAYGLNTLFATNLNLGSNINMNSGLNLQPNTSSNFFDDQPAEKVEKEAVDPFSALESIAIQSNFHTTSYNAQAQSNPADTSMFFTQSNTTGTNANTSVDLI